jgi:hypothetical protein
MYKNLFKRVRGHEIYIYIYICPTENTQIGLYNYVENRTLIIDLLIDGLT